MKHNQTPPLPYCNIDHIKNAHYVQLPEIIDGHDGKLAVAELGKDISFTIKRVYTIYNLQQPHSVRGKHAHKKLEQVLFCLHGNFQMCLDDGTHQTATLMNSPNIGLYVGTYLWHTMTNFTDDCVLMVLASDFYYESDYIRDYRQFLEAILCLPKSSGPE